MAFDRRLRAVCTKLRVNGPSLGGFEDTGKRRRLPQGSHPLAWFLNQSQDVFKRPVENPLPFVQIRCGTTSQKLPASQIVTRNGQ